MSVLSSVKTVLVTLLAAAIIYLAITFMLIPLYRRYVGRYQHYLPLRGVSADGALSSLSAHGSSSWTRTRLSGFYSSLSARLPFDLPFAAVSPRPAVADDDYDDDIEDGEGEGMVGFGLVDGERRREALERQRGAHDTATNHRRLSRELEEGFRDSSSDSGDDGIGESGAQSRTLRR